MLKIIKSLMYVGLFMNLNVSFAVTNKPPLKWEASFFKDCVNFEGITLTLDGLTSFGCKSLDGTIYFFDSNSYEKITNDKYQSANSRILTLSYYYNQIISKRRDGSDIKVYELLPIDLIKNNSLYDLKTMDYLSHKGGSDGSPNQYYELTYQNVTYAWSKSCNSPAFDNFFFKSETRLVEDGFFYVQKLKHSEFFEFVCKFPGGNKFNAYSIKNGFKGNVNYLSVPHLVVVGENKFLISDKYIFALDENYDLIEKSIYFKKINLIDFLTSKIPITSVGDNIKIKALSVNAADTYTSKLFNKAVNNGR